MEVDDDVEPCSPQPPREPQIVGEPRQPSWPIGDDDLVQVRVVLDDGRGSALDQIGDSGVWITPTDRANRRRGEHHVTDEAQANQEDLQGSTVASSISITGMSSLIG